MMSDYYLPLFKVEAIEIDRQLAFARANRDAMMENDSHRETRYYKGRPHTVYTPAFIGACNRVIALEKQAEEFAKPRYRFFGFNHNTDKRAVFYVENFGISENHHD